LSVGKLGTRIFANWFAVPSIFAMITESLFLNLSPNSSHIGASSLQWPHHGASTNMPVNKSTILHNYQPIREDLVSILGRCGGAITNAFDAIIHKNWNHWWLVNTTFSLLQTINTQNICTATNYYQSTIIIGKR